MMNKYIVKKLRHRDHKAIETIAGTDKFEVAESYRQFWTAKEKNEHIYYAIYEYDTNENMLKQIHRG